jgi:tRNA threonylcarbamoyladenosine biosynthesis protein TsaE
MSRAISHALTREELCSWGEALGASLDAPAIVTLEGDIGAGKTTLVQAIARGAGVTEAVTSPTYSLVHTYRARSSMLYHLDLYRLETAAELRALAFDEILADRAIVVIEWPELAKDRIPGKVVRLRLSHLPGDHERREVEDFR